MIVFRVGRTRYARDLTGEGARLFGGRWNHKLTPCIYSSGNRSLAVLEYTVNVNVEDIPRALSLTTFEIPDQNIHVVAEESLPGNWRNAPAPAATKDFGTSLLALGEALVIKIPSAVMPEEFNYLLNPAHPQSQLIKLLEVKDLVYDVRIKLV